MKKAKFVNVRRTCQRVGLIAFCGAASAYAADPLSYNTGSLGTAGDGTHINSPLLDQPGALTVYNDYSVAYSGGSRTTVPFLAAMNPLASSPFTIEFWAKPTGSDGDDAPVANRIATGNRTGWVFFQRGPTAGWNFRMYEASGSSYGWELTGGTSTLNEWSHVVGVWTGSKALLYVNGGLATDTNLSGKSGIYASNPISNAGSIFAVGALFDGGSPYEGAVDDIAYYPTALSAVQIEDHFAAASSPVLDAYSSLVLADGAIEYLQQNPPTVKLSLATGTPKVTFTGVLSQSVGLTVWDDLAVTSPYVVPSPVPAKLFFRSHR